MVNKPVSLFSDKKKGKALYCSPKGIVPFKSAAKVTAWDLFGATYVQCRVEQCAPKHKNKVFTQWWKKDAHPPTGWDLLVKVLLLCSHPVMEKRCPSTNRMGLVRQVHLICSHPVVEKRCPSTNRMGLVSRSPPANTQRQLQ